MLPKQAFILAGGKGERLRPLTENTPKPMIEVQKKPILQHIIEDLTGFGVKQVILGVSYRAERVKEHFGNGANLGTEIVYVREKGFLGTGGALKNAQDLIEDRFLMLNGDTLIDVDFEKMSRFHEQKKASGTLALVRVKDVRGFGVTKLSKNKILEFMEKPSPENAPSNWVNAGAYILEKKTTELIPEGFSLIEKTLFPALATQQKLFAFKHFGQWFPTDDLQKLGKAEKEWSPRRNQNELKRKN